MLANMKIALLGLFVWLGIGSVANAASLNFNEVLAGINPASSVVLSNATINNAGSGSFSIFNGSDPMFPGSNGMGAICGFNGTNCGSSLEIIFNQDVKNLSIGFSGYDDGDQVWITGFLNGSAQTTQIVTSQTSLSLNSFGDIDRLMFLNVSTPEGGGLVYRDIEFDYVSNDTIISTPLPAALPMFGAALGLLGLYRLRQRKNT